MSSNCLHLDLDGAWPADALSGIAYSDRSDWGPALRYCTTEKWIEDFLKKVHGELADFTLYGSGDFHHLTALWLRQVREPFTLVSFDNHPDWDIRPPHWGCGTWLNRALELSTLRQAVIWGCANGELNWPGRMFARKGPRLDARPWAEKTSTYSQRIWRAVSREDWRDQFSVFATRIAKSAVYVTVDLDCMTQDEAQTNWESGLFTAEDVAWALTELRHHARVIGGDVCGAWSAPKYRRPFQKLAAWIDHPKPEPVNARTARARNLRALRLVWPALTGRNECDAGDNQKQADQKAP